MFSNVSLEKFAFYGVTWKKHCRAQQATDDDMAHAHYMLHTYVYKHVLRILLFLCNNG